MLIDLLKGPYKISLKDGQEKASAYEGPDKDRAVSISLLSLILIQSNIFSVVFTIIRVFFISRSIYQRLYEAWARPGRFLCYQPLDLIR